MVVTNPPDPENHMDTMLLSSKHIMIIIKNWNIIKNLKN
jgi:hypothetical protein